MKWNVKLESALLGEIQPQFSRVEGDRRASSLGGFRGTTSEYALLWGPAQNSSPLSTRK